MMKTKHFPRRFLLVPLVMLLSQVALGAAGKVVFVAGDVRVERAALPAPGQALATGDSVEVGDTVITGERSRAQLLMADGARLALRAETRFSIDELELPDAVTSPGQAQAVTADGSSVSTLIRGGFRTQTGSIGKQDSSAYEVRTPVGVLGIRGTEYVAVLCADGACDDLSPGAPVRAGLYLGVYANGIVLSRPGEDDLLIGPGEFLFVPLDGSPPEALPAPPAFLEADATGPLTLAGTGAEVTPPSELPGFSIRRVPADPGQPADAPPADEGPTLPVGGTIDGEPVDLTPGTLQPRAEEGLRNLGWAVGLLDTFPGTALALSVAEDELIPGSGGLASFAAARLFDGPPLPSVFSLGSAGNTDTGNAANLSWGRWSGGEMIVSGEDFTDFNESLANQSLHWIFDEISAAVPVLPISGSQVFQLIGATSPTGTGGEVGILGGASLFADFTSETVFSTLSLVLDGTTWFAAGNASLGAANLFEGFYEEAVAGGTLAVFGNFSGFFSASADFPESLTAGLGYALLDSFGQQPVVSGVLAFGPGSGQPSSPPALDRDIAISYGTFGQEQAFTSVAINDGADYQLDGNLDLLQLANDAPGVDGPEPASYAIGTAAVVESGVDAATLLRWGRWSGGSAEVTDSAGTTPLDLEGSSLHWVTSPNTINPPVLPQGGQATYTLVGATTPTNNLGDTGVLGSASFSANFTDQTVSSALSLDIGQRPWVASGVGSIGGANNLADHQFSGFYENVEIGTGDPEFGNGEFTGFFSSQGGSPLLPDVPGGAALSFTLSDSDFVETVHGVLIFQGPPD